MPKNSPAEDWQLLEGETCEMFRSAGYTVYPKAQVGGKEFDLIATRTEFGGMDVKIVVECKFHEKRNVSNAEVNDFVGAFNSMKISNNFTFGIVVSNNSFSRSSQLTSASNPYIKLLTLQCLQDELFGVRTYFDNIGSFYRNEINNYIELAATNYFDGPNTRSIVDHIVNRFTVSRLPFTLLLGDFGCGKTTVSEEVHRRICEKYKRSETAIFPVITYLRTLEQFNNDDEYILAHTTRASPQLGLKELEKLRQRGGLLFIMDGFDEVATNAKYADRMRITSRIINLMSRCDYALLSSRPTYFDSLNELNDLVQRAHGFNNADTDYLKQRTKRRDKKAVDSLRAQYTSAMRRIKSPSHAATFSDQSSIWHMEPLTEDDIVSYFEPYSRTLKRRYGWDPTDLYTKLTEIYDLSDLLKRPLLLEMFAVLIKDNAIDLSESNAPIGPSALYGLYVDIHLNRDWGVRKLLTVDERKAFARVLAVTLFQSGGSLEASYDRLADAVRYASDEDRDNDAFSAARTTLIKNNLQDIVVDIRICAFINMTPEGRLEFSHKSFMEFFIADVILFDIKNKRPSIILQNPLPYEILYFLGGFCITWSDYRLSMMQHLRDIGYRQNDEYRNNMVGALLLSERSSTDRTFENFSFHKIKFAKRNFVSCLLSQWRVSGAIVADCSFRSCTFDDVDIDGEMTDVEFVGCSGEISFPQQCKRVSIHDSGKLHLISSEEKECEFDKCKVVLTEIHVDGVASFNNTTFDNSNITISKLGLFSAGETRFLELEITMTSQNKASHLEFKSCEFVKVGFDRIIVKGTFDQISRQRYENCYGIILIDDDDKNIQNFIQKGADGVSAYSGFYFQDGILYLARHVSERIADEELKKLYKTIKSKELDFSEFDPLALFSN